MTQDFETYLQQAREDFCKVAYKYNITDHLELRTEVDSLLIAYDQAVEALRKHGVVQAEGSGGYKEHGHGYSAKDKLDTTNPPRQSAVGAAVGNGAAGQSGSGGCRHRWWELADGKVLCDKCGVVKD